MVVGADCPTRTHLLTTARAYDVDPRMALAAHSEPNDGPSACASDAHSARPDHQPLLLLVNAAPLSMPAAPGRWLVGEKYPVAGRAKHHR